MTDTQARARLAAENAQIAQAIGAQDAVTARFLVATQIQELAEWLLAAKTTIERGGHLDDDA